MQDLEKVWAKGEMRAAVKEKEKDYAVICRTNKVSVYKLATELIA
jgi:hypothetical protein